MATRMQRSDSQACGWPSPLPSPPAPSPAASDADADNAATPTPWRVLLTRDVVGLKHLRWHLQLEEQEVCLQHLSPGGCPTKKATCYFRHVPTRDGSSSRRAARRSWC